MDAINWCMLLECGYVEYVGFCQAHRTCPFAYQLSIGNECVLRAQCLGLTEDDLLAMDCVFEEV